MDKYYRFVRRFMSFTNLMGTFKKLKKKKLLIYRYDILIIINEVVCS